MTTIRRVTAGVLETIQFLSHGGDEGHARNRMDGPEHIGDCLYRFAGSVWILVPDSDKKGTWWVNLEVLRDNPDTMMSMFSPGLQENVRRWVEGPGFPYGVKLPPKVDMAGHPPLKRNGLEPTTVIRDELHRHDT